MNLEEREAIFEAWAPTNSPWTPWAKPVLFACMEERDAPAETAPLQGWAEWLPKPDFGALVIDLPGDAGVCSGLFLAQCGWRPTPLYNAAPAPVGNAINVALVETRSIVSALRAGAPLLRGLSLPGDAPPAFLLDANRRSGVQSGCPGQFDNRSVSFPTDFPSAIRLQSHGIRRVLLVQECAEQPQPDLAHTLRRWEEGGLELFAKSLEKPGPPVSLKVEKPSLFRRLRYRFLTAWGLQPNELGGYGGVLEDHGSGG